MIPLIDIIDDTCIEVGDNIFSRRADFTRRAKNTLMRLAGKGDTGSTIVCEVLERDPVTGFIHLPANFIRPIKVGFEHNGNFIGLGHNPKMIPPSYDDCGTVIPIRGGNSKGMPEGLENAPPGYDFDGFPSAYPLWDSSFRSDFGWGDGYMHWYGAAAGWSNGYFRFDNQAHVIQFSSDFPVKVCPKVWVRYQSTGFDAEKPTYVLPQWHDAIKFGILKSWAMHNINTSADRVKYEEYKREYGSAITDAIKATHGSTLAQMVDAMRQTGGGAPRR